MKKMMLLPLILLFVETCWAFPVNYGPFEDFEKPDTFPIYDCVLVDEKSGLEDSGFVYARGSESPVRIHLKVKGEDALSIKMTEGPDRILLPKTSIAGSPFFPFDVFYSDLNNDGTDDYIILTWSDGGGLASFTGYFSVILSASDSYKVIHITTMSPNKSCFIRLGDDNKCRFIHTVFVYGEAGKDGRCHNYWVYNLFEFTGDDLILSNKKSPRFPKWVMYTYNPNHRSTGQLSETQKERLLKLAIEPYDTVKELMLE
jgi:hypothetical protein